MANANIFDQFEFTSDDLNANRSGELSLSQRQRFDQSLDRPIWGNNAVELVGLILLLIGVPAACTFIAWRVIDRFGLTLVLLVVTLIGAYIVLRAIPGVIRAAKTIQNLLREDVQAGRVERAVVRVQYDPDGEHIYLANVERDLWLTHGEVDALPIGSEYIAYYLPQSETVLSLEVYNKEPGSFDEPGSS